MATVNHVRKLALALPGVEEMDHHGFPSFRVKGKIFCTLPDSAHANVMLSPDEATSAASLAGHAVEELWWGKKLSGVKVTLKSADVALVSALLADAWEHKAPAKLKKR